MFKAGIRGLGMVQKRPFQLRDMEMLKHPNDMSC